MTERREIGMHNERQMFWCQNYGTQNKSVYKALIKQFEAEGKPVPQLEPLKSVLPPIGNPSKGSLNLSTIHAGNLSCRPDDLSVNCPPNCRMYARTQTRAPTWSCQRPRCRKARGIEGTAL